MRLRSLTHKEESYQDPDDFSFDHDQRRKNIRSSAWGAVCGILIGILYVVFSVTFTHDESEVEGPKDSIESSVHASGNDFGNNSKTFNIPEKLETPQILRYEDNYILYTNGVVVDVERDLMWAGSDNGENIDWTSAGKYCENYRGGGYTDWRLPTVKELSTLYNRDKEGIKPKCCPVCPDMRFTSCIRLSCCSLWSSDFYNSKVYGFDLCFNSKEIGDKNDSEDLRVIPVRNYSTN